MRSFRTISILRVKITLSEDRLPERFTHQNKRVAIDTGVSDEFLDSRQRAPQDPFIRPARAIDHHRRTILTIKRQQLRDNLIEILYRKMDGHRRTATAKRYQVLPERHLRRASRRSRQDQR